MESNLQNLNKLVQSYRELVTRDINQMIDRSGDGSRDNFLRFLRELEHVVIDAGHWFDMLDDNGRLVDVIPKRGD